MAAKWPQPDFARRRDLQFEPGPQAGVEQECHSIARGFSTHFYRQNEVNRL